MGWAPSAFDVQVVVLAGGLGTRLAPLTNDCPKIMVPVLGQPFAKWQLKLFSQQGVTEVVYCVGHLGHKVRELGDEFAGVKLRYSEESEPLGKLDAVRNALPLLNDWFFVTYGDSYLPDINLHYMYRHFLNLNQTPLMSTWEGTDYGISIYPKKYFETVRFPVIKKWHEIGSPEGLVEFEAYLKKEGVNVT